MRFELSDFGRNVVSPNGLTTLMDDLGNAVANAQGKQLFFFGGGNPASIPEVCQVFRRRWNELNENPEQVDELLGNYALPRGRGSFVKTLVKSLNTRFGWTLTEKNVCVTHGGQGAFFGLFNMLAGDFDHGQRRKEILIPLVPEYIGYAAQSVTGPIFRSQRPKIEYLEDHKFKYSIDFEHLEVRPETAAICVSRPTNPSGNVLTDTEIHRLCDIAEEHNIPLIVDNAYGAPFPQMIFTEAQPILRSNMVLTMSMSKVGLPGVRTAIVIGPEEIISALVKMTTVSALNNNNLGQVLVEPLIQSGELYHLSESVIRPYYKNMSDFACSVLHKVLPNSIDWRLHVNEGALFLWLWLKDLPISSKTLYERLVKRCVFVIPGEDFFFGLPENETFPEQYQCVRLSYAQPKEVVEEGFAILAEEIMKAYQVID